MTTFCIPPSPCPRCNHLYVGATSYEDLIEQPPSPGDYTICPTCEAILVFDRQMHVQFPEPEEWQRLLAAPHKYVLLLSMREAVRRWRRERGNGDIATDA